MSKLVGSLAVAGALFLSGAAQALTITSASLGQGQVCTTSSCTTVLATLTGAGQGSGSISLSGGTLTFSVQGLGATYSDASSATWAFAGTATLSGGGGFYFVTGGAVNATLDGNAVSTLGVGGTCMDPGNGTLSCGLSFTNVGGSPSLGYQSTLNLSAPEPASGALLAGAGVLVAALGIRRRSR
jgi:hypothetical protein